MKAIALTLLVACGGSHAPVDREQESFACRDRSASYMAAGHISGDEIGVQLDCANGPHIKRWKTDHQGHRTEDAHALAPGDFEKLWREIDGTGWANLHDCTNGSLAKGDPVYQFDIKDDQNQASFSCQTREMPYPYNDITDPLDLAASQGRGQLGGDEPPDAAKGHKK